MLKETPKWQHMVTKCNMSIKSNLKSENSFSIEHWDNDQNTWETPLPDINSSSDQTTFNINNSEISSIKNVLTLNWLNSKPLTMTAQENYSDNHTDFLYLKLQQLENSVNQFEIHLLTLKSLDESATIQAKITSIEDSLVKLNVEKQRIEKAINNSTEVTNIFNKKLKYLL